MNIHLNPCGAALALALAMSGGALAQQAAPVAAPAAPAAGADAPSESAMVNLVRALVAKGALSPAEGRVLIEQAEAEAGRARAQAAAAPAPAPGAVRVPYISETVRNQIRDDLREEVIQTARAEGWATPGQRGAFPAPGQLAEWPQRIRISGDFRLRSQYNLFQASNFDQLIDFGTFNDIGPVDVNPSTNPAGLPLRNVTEDEKNQLTVRARIALAARVADGVEVGLRLASGSNDGPISTSQLLGGGFSKKDIWLDRAYARLSPIEEATLTLGRMPNPFYRTPLVWDDDVNFDGVALSGNSGDGLGEDLRLSGTVGAFPFEYGDGDFPAFSTQKQEPFNKWIYGGQVRADWQPDDRFDLSLAVAYYDFNGVQGAASDPCQLFDGNVACSSDPRTPIFLQKGNTLFLSRNIVPAPGEFDPIAPQFAQLSFDYNLINVTFGGAVRLNDKLSLLVSADFVKNVGLDEDDFCKRFAGFPGRPAKPGSPAVPSTPETVRPPVNNIAGSRCEAVTLPVDPDDPDAPTVLPADARYAGGDTGWAVQAQVGYPDVERRGDWNVLFGYRRIESDAVLDSLTDSNFALGGSNAEGFFLAGTLGLYDNVSARARWFSTNEVSGPPLSIDVLQLDLLVGF